MLTGKNQASEAKPEQQIALLDDEQTTKRAASQIEPHQIQSLEQEDLARLKTLAGHGTTLYVWSTPSHWLVHSQRIDAIESIDLREAALTGLNSEERMTVGTSSAYFLDTPFAARMAPALVVERVLMQTVRYLMLLRLVPSGAKAALKASSVAAVAAGAMRRLAPIVVRRLLDVSAEWAHSGTPQKCFGLIQKSDLSVLPKSYAKWCNIELRRMERLCSRGLWVDAPSLIRETATTVDPSQPPETVDPELEIDPHLPLPDAYVAQMGQRSLWIFEKLGPVLLATGEECLTAWKAAAARGFVSKDTRKQIVLRVLSERFPDSPSSTPPEMACPAPPFKIRLSAHGATAGRRFKSLATAAVAASDEDDEGSLESTNWPPRNLAHLTGLFASLQSAHFFIASMATAARQSESMDLRRDCVVYGKDGQWRANGRTFKLVQAFEGEARSWDLPEVAARALEQQRRLVRLLEQMPWSEDLGALLNPDFLGFEGDHLWCRIGTGATVPRELPRCPNRMLRKYARSLDMAEEPGGQPLRTHRFRKTIARLAALAIDEAPLMLKQLFGHKDIEMTLHYILADKALAAEIEQVVKELHMMRAKEPVEAFVARLVSADTAPKGSHAADADFAGYGGKAVARMTDTVRRYRDQAVSAGRMRNSAEDFGAEHIDDVVRVLSSDGTFFNLVRPGVFCTKRMGEWGPCSRKKGQADRSNCQESCDHRLEEPWLRADAEGCVEEAVAGYERARVSGEVLLQSFWADQVRRNVVRFDDLQATWMQNAVVAEVMATAGPASAAAN